MLDSVSDLDQNTCKIAPVHIKLPARAGPERLPGREGPCEVAPTLRSRSPRVHVSLEVLYALEAPVYLMRAHKGKLYYLDRANQVLSRKSAGGVRADSWLVLVMVWPP